MPRRVDRYPIPYEDRIDDRAQCVVDADKQMPDLDVRLMRVPLPAARVALAKLSFHHIPIGEWYRAFRGSSLQQPQCGSRNLAGEYQRLFDILWGDGSDLTTARLCEAAEKLSPEPVLVAIQNWPGIDSSKPQELLR